MGKLIKLSFRVFLFLSSDRFCHFDFQSITVLLTQVKVKVKFSQTGIARVQCVHCDLSVCVLEPVCVYTLGAPLIVLRCTLCSNLFYVHRSVCACALCTRYLSGQNWFYHIGQTDGGVRLRPVLPRPGVATLRCCHLAILCSISDGLVSAPLTERDHLPEEDVEKGFGGEPRGLLCYFRSNYHVTNSGVTGGAGILGVVTLI